MRLPMGIYLDSKQTFLRSQCLDDDPIHVPTGSTSGQMDALGTTQALAPHGASSCLTTKDITFPQPMSCIFCRRRFVLGEQCFIVSIACVDIHKTDRVL